MAWRIMTYQLYKMLLSMPTKKKGMVNKMKFSEEVIMETLKAFVQKERNLYDDEEGVVIGVIAMEGDTQSDIEKNKKIVYGMASKSFGFYEFHQKVMDEHISKNLVDEINIKPSRMINFANHFAQHKNYMGTEIRPGVRVNYVDITDNNYEASNSIRAATEVFGFSFNHIYSFVYIYNRTGETDEFVYPIHLESAIKELLMTGTVRDEEVFI